MEADQSIDYSMLPGGDLVAEGIQDLKNNSITEFALLVLIISPRLFRLGISVRMQATEQSYEHQLYDLLEQKYGDNGYSRYNSLLRRATSFAQALENTSID